MRNVFKLILLLVATCIMFGCAHNYYNIPQEVLEKRIKVVGVAPLFTDAESDIRHPEKAAVVTLIRELNAKNEKELIARLRDTGIFYSVRQVDGDPTTMFVKLLSNRERRDDAGIIYNKYFYKKEELQPIFSDNQLDAVLLVAVSGLTRPGKVYASNYLSYLETDFNYLTMTAQLVDRDGSVIWEYPNFRRSALSYPMMFPLQYPDFDEAAANMSDKVDVKFKTIAGIKAAFAKTEVSAVKGPDVSTLYAKQFDEMISLLQTSKPLFGGKKESAPATPATPAGPLTAPEGALSPAEPPATEVPKATEPAPAAPAAPEAPAAVKPAEPAAAPPGSIVPEQPTGDVVPEQPAK